MKSLSTLGLLSVALLHCFACARTPLGEEVFSDPQPVADAGGDKDAQVAAASRDAQVNDAAPRADASARTTRDAAVVPSTDAGASDAQVSQPVVDAQVSQPVVDAQVSQPVVDAQVGQPVVDAQVSDPGPEPGQPNQCIASMCAPYCPSAVPCCNALDRCACKFGDGPCTLPPLPPLP